MTAYKKKWRMTFSCNRCQTRYHITEEKVRGKILQIRCKACQNIIEVRDPELSGGPSVTPAFSTMTVLGISAVPKGQSGSFPAMRAPSMTPATAPATALPPAFSRPSAPAGNPPAMRASAPAKSLRPTPIPPSKFPSSSSLPIPKPQSPPLPRPSSPSVPAVSRPPSFSGASPAVSSPASRPALRAVRPTSPPPPRPLSQDSPPVLAPRAPKPPPGPPPTPPEPKVWHVSAKGQQNGPYSTSELGEFLQKGKVSPDDLVWCPDQTQWCAARDAAPLALYLPAPASPKEPSSPLPRVFSPAAPSASAGPSLAGPAQEPHPVAEEGASQAGPGEQRAKGPIRSGVSEPTPGDLSSPSVRSNNPPSFTFGVASPPAEALASGPALFESAAPTANNAPSSAGGSSSASPSAPGVASAAELGAPPSSASVPAPFPVEQDIFASVPNAPDFRAAPIREVSALIPLSATKPSLARRMVKPAILAAGYVLVAAAFYLLGRQSVTLADGSDATAQAGEPSATQPSGEPTTFSDSDLDKLSGLGDPASPEAPKNVQTSKTNGARPKDAPGGTNTAVLNPKTKEEQKKALDLFSNLGKTSVTPPPAETSSNNTISTAAQRAAREEAMKIIERNQTGATRCLERSLTGGEIKQETRLDVTIQLDAVGKVTSVSIKNAPSGSSLGNCLRSHYSRISFRTVSGPIPVNFPLLVSPTL